jgi:hypothetical protein
MPMNPVTVQMTTWRTIVPRPMSCVNTVMRDLDISSPKVMELIEEGRLTAFNISANASSRCRELRVLTKSVEHYLTAGWKKPLIMDWPEILRHILPHERLLVRSSEIERYLNTSRVHVWALIKANCLVPGSANRANVTRESFENFLKGRMQ